MNYNQPNSGRCSGGEIISVLSTSSTYRGKILDELRVKFNTEKKDIDLRNIDTLIHGIAQFQLSFDSANKSDLTKKLHSRFMPELIMIFPDPSYQHHISQFPETLLNREEAPSLTNLLNVLTRIIDYFTETGIIDPFVSNMVLPALFGPDCKKLKFEVPFEPAKKVVLIRGDHTDEHQDDLQFLVDVLADENPSKKHSTIELITVRALGHVGHTTREVFGLSAATLWPNFGYQIKARPIAVDQLRDDAERCTTCL
jgi:hypothetical protein